MFMATLVLTFMGFFFGGALAIAAKRLSTGEEDPLLKEIEELLPGSQCGQCGFPGCKPAAEAIMNGSAELTCCPPGGRGLAENLAGLLNIDISSIGEAQGPLLASIDEAFCTGCTKCFKACPTDAIVGANKQIHVVIGKACTGCSKCRDVCPEDCISLQGEAITLDNWNWSKPMVA